MFIENLLFGRALKTSEERAEQIGPREAVPIFGLDALSSAGYGPEAALTILIPLGAAGPHWVLPVTFAILALLGVVYVSYLQTIEAYPGGGGSYTVARENLGENAGLLAAAALLIDYVLVVAVGIAAGVGALVSMAPGLQPHTLGLCLWILLLIAYVNLRGLREAGKLFMIPTYLFVGALGMLIVVGLTRAAFERGHPAPAALINRPSSYGRISVWLLLQAFASGCTAMTGVEAVSNGVKAFREPAAANAKRALTYIIAILACLLLGIALLARIYGVAATEPGSPGYESVISQLIRVCVGEGVFYYAAMASVLLVLALSANTAFADFPRLCQLLARDGYLPLSFALRGRRLVYAQGITVLTVLSGVLLALFDGVTDRLIPLFAIGAFLAFTLSQLGMVYHWKRVGGENARRNIRLNGVGAAATGLTVLVVLLAKFVDGAWVTALLVPALFYGMRGIKRHYEQVKAELKSDAPLELDHLKSPMVVVPITSWNKAAKNALRFALQLSSEVQAVHVKSELPEPSLRRLWAADVEAPAKAAGKPAPELKILTSAYRDVLAPLVDHVLKVAKEHPERQVAVVIPQVVENRWYDGLLHAQRAMLMNAYLYFYGARRIVVISARWYLGESDGPKA